MRVIICLFLSIISPALVAQSDHLSIRVGGFQPDAVLTDEKGWNFELQYEKKVVKNLVIGAGVGVGLFDDFPSYMKPTQQLFSGVPPKADEVIRRLTFPEYFNFEFDQIATNYLNLYCSYQLVQVFGYQLRITPGINFLNQQTAYFALDEAKFKNGTIDEYKVAYRVETFRDLAWSAEVSIQKQFTQKTSVLIYGRFTQIFRVQDFATDYTLFGVGLKREVYW
ncbi:hypothetical protein [Marinoscillum furvescens]|uniref:Outer membrane protein with beta-barrel domain n=1 Tax=Marinoscillum furvescens DSM 4134 TaxID=1122208 RepID=A0A3D9L560_MARFU|nr:hypothetical protein [Marinoscillum furvescens]REE01049.1 hypothetical protein C7460_10468 [Marinoscillum furvescens DSM 4134]